MSLSALYQQVFEAAAKGGMQTIINAAYSVIKMPIIVTDVSFRNLAIAPCESLGDKIWDTMLLIGGAPQEMVVGFHKEKYMHAAFTETPPYYVDWGDCQKLPRIQEIIKINDVVEGYVAILCPRERHEPWHDQASTIIAKACSMELERKANHNLEGNPLSLLLVKELFDNRIVTPEQLELWKHGLNLSFSGDFLLFAVQADYAKTTTVLKYMLGQLKQQYPHQLSLLEGNVLLLLLYGLAEQDNTCAVETRIKLILRPFNARSGVSRRFTNILELDTYRFQAEESLKLGIESTDNHFIYRYDDYVLPIVLHRFTRNITKSNWISPAIPRVASYDEENGTSYLETLETYVLEICSSQRVTDLLHIHRNTLLYRLNKIEEIIGFPISDPKYYPHLLLSFQMLNMQQGQYHAEGVSVTTKYK
ncbi:PucR family transcriptional regulator [Paenibacillus etheri]|uniref:PucR C-terminal helix-turn-helix domain-containing protein n=1 Tax=Paenibacillus etheri TaxID=1306852 RepID=A0A0W1ATM2_9BACL|nr:helix-turn-helix domain-containing protein [Paenibacillus etheri]KTD84605.1 hypothetical protein UQ64_23375 [Paenibacillus etheri]